MAGRELRGEDLTGQPREMFEAWRALGHTEQQAMRFLREDGALAEAGVDDPFDRLADLGRGLGLSEAQSRLFATGRDGSEWEARKALRESTRESAAEVTALEREVSAAARAVARLVGQTEAVGRSIVLEKVREAASTAGEGGKVRAAVEKARELREVSEPWKGDQ